MKNSKNGWKLNILLILALTITIVLGSCAQRVRFRPSKLVPSAQGYVKITKDESQNHTIKIKVSNVSTPQKLYPSKEVYVVWIETEKNGVKKLGQLEGFLRYGSNRPGGTLNTVTPFKPIKIFITAEDTGSSNVPGSQILLQTRNFD
ncbi:hypothetical protein WG906_12480 [Pedobacter sp. P351]|uniref:hypothetical protein n=1 Tax=Pedobacter superstes TaxID=3133441 RepID=UPI00309B8A7C